MLRFIIIILVAATSVLQAGVKKDILNIYNKQTSTKLRAYIFENTNFIDYTLYKKVLSYCVND